MWTKRIWTLTYILMVTGIIIQVYTSLLMGNTDMLRLQGIFAVIYAALIWVRGYIGKQQDKAKKHDQDIDTDRLTRLSLPEVYEDYLRRKQQAQALFESEVAALDKDYAQYLNALEEEAMNSDSL